MDTNQETTRVVDADDVSEPSAVAPREPASPLTGGTEVGRYVLLERIGKGGMGEVYAAYDPELDRKVALKVLAPHKRDADSADSEGGEARLVREAQAMAKLSHPGVAQVYDAGSVDGRVFIAMEFIDGMTLRDWVSKTQPSFPELTRALLLAGEGLAAAHRAGLVHRDFKPHNVMVRRDGVVRVLDFGLARRVDGAKTQDPPRVPTSHPAADAMEISASRNSLSQPLTQTGMVHGTPAYMAPEQFTGGTVDARTDQFAYCIAVYEAYYGERPFPHGDYRELVNSVCRGEYRDPPRGASLPPRVRRLLLQGMHPDPEKRHASMDALLRRLRDAAVPAWRRPAFLGLGAIVAVGLGISASGSRADEAAAAAPCEGVEHKLTEIWNESRKGEIGARFASLELAYATGTWDRTSTLIDEYAGDWAEMRAEACEATRVTAEQSEELMDRRVACLDRHLAELEALTQVLEEADAGVAERAVSTSAKLTPVSACSADSVLRSPDALPEDEALRRRVLELDEEAARAAIRLKAGRQAEAKAELEVVMKEALELGHQPLVAQVGYNLGAAGYAMGDPVASQKYLEDALAAALESNVEQVELRCHISLAGVAGAFLAKPDVGRAHARLAIALSRRVDGGPEASGMIDTFLGLIELQEGNNELAIAHFDDAISEREVVFGEGTPEAAAMKLNAATALARSGRDEEAQQKFEDILEVYERGYGAGHPLAGVTRINLGTMYSRAGEIDRALAMFDGAVDILDGAHPDGSLHLAKALHNRAAMLLYSNEYDRAEVDLKRALAMKTAKAGPDNPSTVMTKLNLADIEIRRGNFAAALERTEPLVPLLRKAYGDTPTFAVALVTQAQALFGLGRLEDAAEVASSGIELLGELGEPDQRAEARFVLAQSRHGLAQTSEEREAALAIADEAIAIFAELGPGVEARRTKLEAWRARH